MKKHLIAAAVAAAVAVPAMAQDVQVYGILDQGYRDTDINVKLSGVKTKADSTSTVVGGAYTTQRLGFRGTEDLGNGLKAFFNYEVGLGGSGSGASNGDGAVGGVDTGADSNTTANTNNITTRQAHVGISGGFGSIKLGQMTTQAEMAWGVGDVGSGNNFIGRAYPSGAGLKLSNARSSRLIEYTSPKFNGFSVGVQYGKGSIKDGQTDSHSEVGLGLGYSAGPLNVMLGYSKEETKLSDAKTAKPKEMVLGANYNFGPAIAFVTYADGDNTQNLSTILGFALNSTIEVDTDNKVWEIGVRVPVGAVALQASYFDGSSKYKIDGVGSAKVNKDGYQLAALYSIDLKP
jgi:general bacterial porin, GBP family